MNSYMLVLVPIIIVPQSPLKTAPNHILLPSPIVTSPIMTAVGAMNTDSWIWGILPVLGLDMIIGMISSQTHRILKMKN